MDGVMGEELAVSSGAQMRRSGETQQDSESDSICGRPAAEAASCVSLTIIHIQQENILSAQKISSLNVMETVFRDDPDPKPLIHSLKDPDLKSSVEFVTRRKT